MAALSEAPFLSGSSRDNVYSYVAHSQLNESFEEDKENSFCVADNVHECASYISNVSSGLVVIFTFVWICLLCLGAGGAGVWLCRHDERRGRREDGERCAWTVEAVSKLSE